MLGLAGLLLIALVALVGPRFLPYDPTAVDVLQKLQPPSAARWLGTDYLGRDLLSRTVDGAHRSLGTAVAVVGMVMLISVGLGALAGFAGAPWTPASCAWWTSCWGCRAGAGPGPGGHPGALPGHPDAGPRLRPVPVVHPPYGRWSCRSGERPYVLVARVHGAGPLATVWRHVLPAVLGVLAVLATLDLGSVVLAVAGLSFLGLGVQPPGGVGRCSTTGITFSQHPADDRAGGLHLLHRPLRQPPGRRPAGRPRSHLGGPPGVSPGAPPAWITRTGRCSPCAGCGSTYAGGCRPCGDRPGRGPRRGPGRGGRERLRQEHWPPPCCASSRRQPPSRARAGRGGRLRRPRCHAGREGSKGSKGQPGEAERGKSSGYGGPGRAGGAGPHEQLQPRAAGWGARGGGPSPARPALRAGLWPWAVGLLEGLRIPQPERRAKQYPHEWSGGMLQRGAIAPASANSLACCWRTSPRPP